MIPLRHRSTLRTVGPLILAIDQAVEDETPLFAAERDFARDHGGPITRAFVDALPADCGDGVIIDSSLVWLTPGLVHGLEVGASGRASGPRSPPRFIHEPFPGVWTGVRGAANRNREAIQRMCIFGLDCTPEVAVGELAFSDANEAEAFWLPREGLEGREREIERRLNTGSLVRQQLPLNSIVEFGWGTLMRARPAASPGFQLVLRATLHDRRPPVNGRRNLSML